MEGISNLTSWEKQESLLGLKAEYLNQLDITKRKAHVLSKYIDDLKHEIDRATKEETIAERGKLLFLTQQAASYTYIVELLVKNNAALELQDASSMLSGEQLKAQSMFYKDATELLVILESSFERAIAQPVSTFVRMYDGFKSIMETYPKTCAVAVLGGGATGAAYGIGLLGGSAHILGLHSWGVELALICGTTGLVAGLVVVSAIALCQYASYIFDEETDSDWTDIFNAIDHLKTQEMPIDTLLELRKTYELAYVFPMSEPTASDQCIICHQNFPLVECADDDRYTRAPGCHAAHFTHRKCLLDRIATSGSLKCTVCEQNGG